MDVATGVDLVILGAGPPHRGEEPAALRKAGSVPALSWVVSAAQGLVEDRYFVGGYHARDVQEHFSDLNVIQNVDWQNTGSAGSLLCAPLAANRACIACYGDVLFRADAIRNLLKSNAPVCVAVDSRWRQRYAGRTQDDMARCEKLIFQGGRVLALGQGLSLDLANGEFVGLVLLKPEAVRRLTELAERFPAEISRLNLSALVEWLRLSGLEIAFTDLAGDWAELNEPQDLARFILGTKAETLARLRGKVSHSVILDQVAFTAGDWAQAPQACLGRVRDLFGKSPLVVRSSSNKEDSFSAAAAGVYTSLLNVDPDTGLEAAVEEVFGSYGERQNDEQVLVQPFITGVKMHGVIFTRTLEHGAPYYVINYDESGGTDGITSGTATESQTLIVHREADIESIDAGFRPILRAVKELEEILNYDALDIEFAVNRDGAVHIFQVRPIAVGWDEGAATDKACRRVLASARATWDRVASPQPFIPGGAPVFGVMPDWNPAEIIGTAPRALSTSLYKLLIMDEAWATQRAEYGYRDLRPQPLLTVFAGRPYVDVRASFTSFVPAELDDALAGRLVSFYLEWLKAHPHLHDKVEFDVVPTCMSLTFTNWEERLSKDGGFSRDEIAALAKGLLRITHGAFYREGRDMASVATMRGRYARIVADTALGHRDRARMLLDDARRYGTVPFSHLARSGFVSATLLRSAQARGIIGKDAIEAFMGSLNTVTRQFSHDIAAAAEGTLGMDQVVERYGHLRPGTYDITSPRYASDVDTYIRPLVEAAKSSPPEAEADLGPWLRDRDAFFKALAEAGLPCDPALVEGFMREAIAGREEAKFHFTRNLSLALEEIGHMGEALGLTLAQLADLPIETIMAAGDGRPRDLTPARLAELAAINDAAQKAAASSPMPALLTSQDDFMAFRLMTTQPNFVGMTKVRAEVVCLDSPEAANQDLRGKAVLIPQADPGYDWLFGQKIAALVTMYGGANSHMAIRSAEFRLPAAIGVGERLYGELSKARIIELDPANQRIAGLA